MLYEQYTIGGELMHSAKGVEWKNKKYIDKIKTKTGKWRYIYKNKNTKENYQKMLNKHGVQTNNKRGKKYIDVKGTIASTRHMLDASNRYGQEYYKLQKDIESDDIDNAERRAELLAHLNKEQTDAYKNLYKNADHINTVLHPIKATNNKLWNMLNATINEIDKRKKKK